MTVAAMILISYYFQWHFFPLTDSHHWLGFFVVIGSGIQGVLGLWAHWVYNPNRAAAPVVPDRLHAVIGKALWIAAIYNCYTGIPMVCVVFFFSLCFFSLSDPFDS